MIRHRQIKNQADIKMAAQLHLILLLGLLCLHLVASNDTATKILNLESRITTLESSNKKLVSSIHSLISTNQAQSHEIELLRNKSSGYCQGLTGNVCGECACYDDYRSAKKYYCDCQVLAPRRDCLAFYQAGFKISGIYKITMINKNPTQVFCDQTTDGGGWTVIQRRVDGQLNFYRNWNEYKEGFGEFQHEYYFGNENIHSLTLQAIFPTGSQLRIDMKDMNENYGYAKYSAFQVDNETTKYVMHVSGYSGNCGDSMKIQDGGRFSTYDSGSSCARSYRGAWWFKNCLFSNLNGEYLIYGQSQPGTHRGIMWYYWKNSHTNPLKFTEMKVRRNL